MPAGIGAAITGIVGTAGATAATADLIGAIAGPAIFGAGLGTIGSAVTGGDLGHGALFGGLTGGALGGAGAIGGSLGLEAGGLGQGLLDVGLGAGAGAASAGITGGNVGKGALFGGIAGGADALLTSGPLGSGSTSGASLNPTGAAPSVGGASGVSQADSTAVAAGGLPDLTGLPELSVTGTAAPTAFGADAGAASLGAAPNNLTFASGGGASAPVADEITITGAPAPPAFGSSDGLIAGGTAAGTGGGITSQDLGVAPTQQSLSTPVVGAKGIAAGQDGALGGGGGPSTSLGKFISDPTLKNAGSVLTSNPATVLGLGGLAYAAASQPSLPDTSEITNSLKATADKFTAQGTALTSYINNGNLPPGAMAAINSASASAKATLKSKFASMGLSGSTSEATALAQVDQQVAGQIFQEANSLLETGIKESGLSADLYKEILGQNNQSNAIMSSAISNFATAVAGGGKGINLNIGGGT